MNKKRYDMENLSIGDIRRIFYESGEVLVFIVFIEDGVETRYRVDIPCDDLAFINLISDRFTLGFDGVDSGSFSFLECDFLDVYFKYPI